MADKYKTFFDFTVSEADKIKVKRTRKPSEESDSNPEDEKDEKSDKEKAQEFASKNFKTPRARKH